MKKFIATLLGGTMFFLATSAMAIPISGTINFIGFDSFAGGTTAATATGINFQGPAFTGPGNTGDYAGVFSSNVQFTNFSFIPSLSPSSFTLWSFTSNGNTYKFDMNSVTSQISAGGNSLTLVGTGLLGITGFDDTFGNWIFTTQGNSATISFSAFASAAAAPVPEPFTIVLLGSGLIGLGGFSRCRMRKQI